MFSNTIDCLRKHHTVSKKSVLEKSRELRNAISHAGLYYNIEKEEFDFFSDENKFTEDDISNIVRDLFLVYEYLDKRIKYSIYSSCSFDVNQWQKHLSSRYPRGHISFMRDIQLKITIKTGLTEIITKFEKINEKYLYIDV